MKFLWKFLFPNFFNIVYMSNYLTKYMYEYIEIFCYFFAVYILFPNSGFRILRGKCCSVSSDGSYIAKKKKWCGWSHLSRVLRSLANVETSRSFGLSVRMHTHIAMSNDDDKGYVQFYKASRVLFVKKSRWNRLHPLTSRSRAQPTLLFTREHGQVCIHTRAPFSLFAVSNKDQRIDVLKLQESA